MNELRWYEDAPLSLKISAQPAVNAARGQTGIIESDDYRGEPVLAAYTYIPTTRWGLVAKQDLEELYEPIEAMFRQLIVLFLGTVTVVSVAALFLARNIAAPIVSVSHISRQIADGNLSLRFHTPRADEFGKLSRSLNSMTEALESRMTIHEGNVEFSQIMVSTKSLEEFRSQLTTYLVEKTGSCLGVYYLRQKPEDVYAPAFSIGANPESLHAFSASGPEGELGLAISRGKMTHIPNLPDDSRFAFLTTAGKVVPKELLCIPVTVDGVVEAVISLASLSGYRSELLELLEQNLVTMNTKIANLYAAEQVKALAQEMETKNQELEIQSWELKQQAQTLEQQNRELEIQSRQVQEANRLKSEFLSNMSHELRTPLNSVIALSKVLIMQAKEKLDEEEHTYLHIIARNGKHLLDLINDILDLSKIESGKVEINVTACSMLHTIDGIVESLEPLAREKGIEIHTDIPQDIPAMTSDEAKIHHILQNVIGNAVKFTEQGHVKISAQVDADNLVVTVTDTGIGIPKDALPYIFEEFRQADGSASRKFEGTGLGLSIALKYAKLLGGNIVANSTEGEGSIFSIILPLVVQGAQVAAAREPVLPFAHIRHESRPPTPDQMPSPRLLLVEDSDAAIIQIQYVLTQQGFLIDVARNGQEAIDYMAAHSPDGIILDLMMPGMDGFEVLEQMRSRDTTATIPVLILTAKDLTQNDMARLSANNIQQLVQKGDVDIPQLLCKIQQMLGINAQALGINTQAQRSSRLKPATKDHQGDSSSLSGEPGVLNPGAPTILIIEDHPDNMTTIKAILQQRYALLDVGNGEEGLRTAKESRPDLILLDISPPGMDGFEVLKQFKADEQTRTIPVIVLTARAMKGDRERILQAGCDEYISKPVDPEELLTGVEKYLK